MLSLERELLALRAAGELDARTAEPLLLAERRQLFSLHYELRFVTYAAMLLVVAGVGMLLRENLERIGPVTIALGIAAAAVLLYAFAWQRQVKNASSAIHEYVVLLATLLVAADLAYAERQFDLLGKYGYDHFLAVAIFSAVVAYRFDSKLVMATALAALAAWFGVDRATATLLETSSEVGTRALLCAAAILAWRELHQRSGRSVRLLPPFEHFAANLIGIGAAAWTMDDSLRWYGFALAAGLSGLLFVLARRRRSELFLLYAVAWSVFATSVLAVEYITEEALLFFYFVFAFASAITLLFVAHLRWRFDE